MDAFARHGAATGGRTAQPAGRRFWLLAAALPLAAAWLLATVVGSVAPAQQTASAAASLAADESVGRITDVQGVVMHKALTGQRWTPVERGEPLASGAWLMAQLRGAHAAAVQLASGARIVLGPGGLVELIVADRIRLTAGEMSLEPAGKTIELVGPDNKPLRIASAGVYRVHGEQLSLVKSDPAWLRSFQSRSRETLGSLIAQVDGRNVSLSVGYHTVNVDIRDQIARTVVEESFVNHTGGTLEGVFTFPLPDGASVSGFGMWIGDELIEADIVEKQRAREIFETLVREKADPALLEWSGGNLFKTRVWPIPPHSAKRVRLTYTQVLPWRGAGYRYRYALESEMLKLHPLERLEINVRIDSALPLERVACLSHPARLNRSEHAATVEFAAQSYVPTRDFEVDIAPTTRQAEAVLITHRRGNDGYFMLQLMPPGSSVDWQRSESAGTSEPLELLILADTSASMDAMSRGRQAEVVGALLASLSPRDRFDLATCDAACRWAFDSPVEADGQHVAAARKFYDDRRSLGWTDLDAAFDAALKKCTPRTHLVYVGDGIPTTGDADAVAFVQRLERRYQGQHATLHAVAVSSSYEPAVLRGIARLGGGSERMVSAETPPAAAVRELLNEIIRPGLKNLQVELRGLRTAGVFPQPLPNLPAGSQQLVLGRFLPQATDQHCRVVVRGTQDGRPVEFSHDVTLAAGDEGNSFVPRLWARLYLDELLGQGSTPALRDQIVELSQRYHIITPYTSLLVLETDALRSRFGVQRHYEMRDGERFFAAGRDRVELALRQQQIERAGQWRVGLRRAVLRHLATLGRDERFPTVDQIDQLSWQLSHDAGVGRGMGGSMGGGGFGGMGGGMGGMGMVGMGMGGGAFVTDDVYGEATVDVMVQEETDVPLLESGDWDVSQDEDYDGPSTQNMMLGAVSVPMYESSGGRYGGRRGELPTLDPLAGVLPLVEGVIRSDDVPSRDAARWFGDPSIDWQTIWYSQNRWVSLPLSFFPVLPAAPQQQPTPQSAWPAEAKTISASLLRTRQMQQSAAGWEISLQSRIRNAEENELLPAGSSKLVIRSGAWLARIERSGDLANVQWCNDHERAAVAAADRFGHRRKPVALDHVGLPLEFAGHLLHSLEEAFGRSYALRVQPQAGDRVLLLLDPNKSWEPQYRILVDRARGVELEIEELAGGQLSQKTVFSDFVQVAGSWLAGTIEVLDPSGRVTTQTTRTFHQLAPGEFDRQWKAEQARLGTIEWLNEPLPTLAAARHARAAGRATFADRMVLAGDYFTRQDWPRMFAEMAAARQLAKDVPGIAWLEVELLVRGTRQQEAKERLLAMAGKLAAAKPATDDLFFANRAIRFAQQALTPAETLRLLDRLEAVYRRAPQPIDGWREWAQSRAALLSSAGLAEQAAAMHKQLADRYPRAASLQTAYAQALASTGDDAEAYRWLDHAASLLPPANRDAASQLLATRVDLLNRQGNSARIVELLARRVEDETDDRNLTTSYLEALVDDNRPDEAVQVACRWLKAGCRAKELSSASEARVWAAMQLAEKWHQNNTHAIDPGWTDTLADVAWCAAQDRSNSHHLEQTFSYRWFVRSDQGQQVLGKIQRLLAEKIAELPAEQIHRCVHWLTPQDFPGDPFLDGQDFPDDRSAWRKLRDLVRERWRAERDGESKHLLGETLAQILRSRFDGEGLADFYREMLESDAARYRAQDRANWFRSLLAASWSDQHERDALSLVGKLGDEDLPPAALLAVRIGALEQLTEQMVNSRRRLAVEAVRNPQELTRAAWSAKRSEAGRQARLAVARLLQAEAARQPGPLARWMQAEAIDLRILAGDALREQAEAIWSLLPADPAKAANDRNFQSLEPRLVHRLLTALLDLAARRDAGALSDRLLDYLDRAIAAAPTATRWKLYKAQLLVALDRPQPLEKALIVWVNTGGDDESLFRRLLAYLAAETGRLDEAIKQFQQLQALDELRPADLRTLSDWYLATGRKEQSERALADAYEAVPADELLGWLYQRRVRWGSENEAIGAGDDAIRRALLALLKKSNRRGYAANIAVELFRQTHDESLLAGLPDTVLGHTAEKVYPLLESFKPLLAEIRNEAASDRVVERIAELKAEDPASTDARALDLLEALLERSAAETLDQPGPHVERAVAALKRAFQHRLGESETGPMAAIVEGLGKISQPELAAEQLRELEELYRQAPPASASSLRIARSLASTHALYGRLEEAARVLDAELSSRQQAHGQSLGNTDREALSQLIAYFEQMRQFRRGEKRLADLLAASTTAGQRNWLSQGLNSLYCQCLADGGDVTLGSGERLFNILEPRLRKALAAAQLPERGELVAMLTGLYSTAKDQDMAGAAAALRSAIPELLEICRRPSGQSQPAFAVARCIGRVIGQQDELEFIVTLLEHEPQWIRMRHNEWSLEHELAEVRQKAGKLPPDLEKRLTQLVVAALKAMLEGRAPQLSMLYTVNPYFWEEKRPAFIEAADQVAARHAASLNTIKAVAEYFSQSLLDDMAAIEVLEAAYARKQLDIAGLRRLAQLEQGHASWARSIAPLVELKSKMPDDLDCRLQLLTAYFHTKELGKLDPLLAETDTQFHRPQHWDWVTAGALGHTCVVIQHYPEAAAYCRQAIALLEHSVDSFYEFGRGERSAYYQDLALALDGMKNTAAAVDAAASAIVVWPANESGRTAALETLKRVLAASPDLDAFVRQLDREAADTGQDKPIIRRALGEMYAQRDDTRKKAIRQFTLAAELLPDDEQTLASLLACYDDLGDAQGAVQTLLRILEISRRNPQQWQNLADRLEALGKKDEAWRAYTSGVEMQPQEAESHQRLAEICQRLGHWPQAIVQWRQAARLRSLEPTGLVGLARAQIHQKQFTDARASINQLKGHAWPERFNVAHQIEQLQRELSRNQSDE